VAANPVVIPVRLFGGPLDGRSAPSGADIPQADSLELLNLSDPPTSLGPNAQVSYTVCTYVHVGGRRYEFKGSRSRTMKNGRYVALKFAEVQFAKVKALLVDPRLIEGRRGMAVPADAFPLDEAESMKARAVAVTRRRHKAAGQPLDDLNDGQVWDFTRGAIKADLAWAMMGSSLHLEGMQEAVQELFGIECPAWLEEWPADSIL
jgi:hypothetical protein